MANRSVTFTGITFENPFLLSSAPPTESENNILRAFDASLFAPSQEPVTLGFHPPIPVVGDAMALLTSARGYKYLAVIFPMGLFNVIGSLQNLESAEAAGDRYETMPSLLANGIGTIAAALFGIWPSLAWLALPLPVLLLVITATALGLGLSAVNVYYRDVRYALPFVLQLGLIVSPVVYPLALVPPAWRTLYAIANPVAAAIDGLRRIILHQSTPDWGITLAALAWSLLLLLGAAILFKRLERSVSDRV